MTALRRRMIEDMQLRNLASHTQAHLRHHEIVFPCRIGSYIVTDCLWHYATVFWRGLQERETDLRVEPRSQGRRRLLESPCQRRLVSDCG